MVEIAVISSWIGNGLRFWLIAHLKYLKAFAKERCRLDRI
jgi:hypothetical protein